MKKQSNLSRLMGYAQKYKALTYLSWILSVISALLALVPFWYIWRIIHDILEVSPNFSQAEHVTQYGLVCRTLRGTVRCCIYCRAHVFPRQRVPGRSQYPQGTDAAPSPRCRSV